MLLVLILAACDSPFAKSPPPAPTPVPSQSPDPGNSILVADGAMQSGRYAAAEADYLALIAAGSAEARAHYATLLDYEGKFEEAIAQAQSAVTQAPTSSALARLTRALDWSNQIPAAVATGARAVAATPADPLAHAFLAEALADSGRYTAAEAEQAAATAAANDAYSKSEVEREWSNYWRDRGDSQKELTHLQSAVSLQPDFPERQLELARYYYEGAQPQLAEAHRIFDAVKKRWGGSYAILLEIGDSTAVAGDTDTATAYYQAALKVQPAGAAASLGLAQISVAKKRDFKAAHDLLAAAIKANPGDGPVYEYLKYLDMLVLHTDPASDLPAAEPAYLAAARKTAYATVNAYRRSVGLGPVKVDAAIEQGALAHCYYFLFNSGDKSLAGLGVHQEMTSLPGFTGENGLVRDRHFGYGGVRGSEVLDHVYAPAAAVEVWADSVYHRLPITDPETQDQGYGEARVGLLSISVMDFGTGDPGAGGPIAYPYPGQAGVPGTFTGNEIPDPVPAGAVYPVGYPVTLQYGSARTLKVDSARLIGPDGAAVPSYVLAPGTQDLGPNEWSLLAQSALQAGQTYTVDLSGQLDGAPWSKRWTFTVAPQ